jgi:periplasmic protein TonB
MKNFHIVIACMFIVPQAFSQDQHEEIFAIVEHQPQFPGGMGAFYRYIIDNLRYPSEAKQEGREGRVYVQYVIDTTGAIMPESVVVRKGVHEALDQEAVRLLKESPKWIPGRNEEGKAVKVRMILPITLSWTRSQRRIGGEHKER